MSDNPFLKRASQEGKQSKAYWRSRKQEKQIAKGLGGWTVSGSGSGKKKGDVQVRGIARIEAKSTQRKSFSVTREMVEKIKNAGIAHDEVPAIVIEFLDEYGSPESEVAVIPTWALNLLLSDDK